MKKTTAVLAELAGRVATALVYRDDSGEEISMIVRFPDGSDAWVTWNPDDRINVYMTPGNRYKPLRASHHGSLPCTIELNEEGELPYILHLDAP